MALSINERLALLAEKGIKQKYIALCVGDKNISTVNNVIHERNKTGKKTKKIQSVITALFELPHEHVWGTDD